MVEQELLKRITSNPKIFGGKPIIRGRRLAVEHILGMLAAGDSAETMSLAGYERATRVLLTEGISGEGRKFWFKQKFKTQQKYQLVL